MNAKKMYECGICYFRGIVEDFTPFTASADLAALECPNCLNNDADEFLEITPAIEQAA